MKHYGAGPGATRFWDNWLGLSCSPCPSGTFSADEGKTVHTTASSGFQCSEEVEGTAAVMSDDGEK